MRQETELAHAIMQCWQQAVAGDPVPGSVLVVPHARMGEPGEYGSITVPFDHDDEGHEVMRAARASVEHGASRSPIFVAMASPAFVVVNDGSHRPIPASSAELAQAFADGDERVRDTVIVNIALRGSDDVYVLPFEAPLLEPMLAEAEPVDNQPKTAADMVRRVMRYLTEG